MTRALAMLLFAIGVAAAQPACATAADTEFVFRPHPGTLLPLDAGLVDEHGRPQPLGAVFTGRPVVLVLEYLRCRTLCGPTLDSLMAALDALPLDAGRDFRLAAISIDPRDTPADAAAAKAKYLAGYHHPNGGGGLHFLTGPEPAVRRIAEAVGFPYRYDPVIGQYIHPAGFVIATPDGRISRYVLGVAPTAQELQAGLTEAARGETVGPLTRLLLLCRAAGVPGGRYSVPILAAFAVANIAGVGALIAVFAAIRRHRG
jgi:protein SCO1/2